MTVEVTETIAAPASAVYAAVSDVKRMARLSPECFAVWITSRGPRQRFVGWNRRRGYVWFTSCRVTVAEPGREFAYEVSSFGQPVARWGYRLSTVDGGTEVTQYWEDQRNKAAFVLGRIFTGKAATDRPAVNLDGMRENLTRPKKSLVSG